MTTYNTEPDPNHLGPNEPEPVDALKLCDECDRLDSAASPGPWIWKQCYEIEGGVLHWAIENEESASEGCVVDASLVLLHSFPRSIAFDPADTNPNWIYISRARTLLPALAKLCREQAGEIAKLNGIGIGLAESIVEWKLRIVRLQKLTDDLLDHERNTVIGKEIERLKGIVEKLPKTADGVIVIPGINRVHHANWDYTDGIEVAAVHERNADYYMEDNGKQLPDDEQWIAEAWYSEADVGFSDRFIKLVSDCYSTREAALAAAEGKP